ncbi:MAG: ArsS family sensor histidine kinase [Campylobacterota bacterium]|nr:ArsS family sensor histidine kinase [Campylobacterota bacterium]
MRLYSLRSKINLIFSLALILLVLLFLAAIEYQEKRSMEDMIQQERENSHYLYLYYLKYNKIDSSYLGSQNIRIVTGKEQKGLIQQFTRDKEGKAHYQVITYHYKRFILINNERFNLLLENMNKPTFLLELSLLFSGALLLLLFLYIWIIRSLKPLSDLKEKIKTFSEGNLNIECKSYKSDEIAAVANEFDQAVKMIRELIHSRQLFLRAIMHELKTPIAKGRLVSEMIDDKKQKERLDRIFIRLNLLIDEFAKLEQITSKNFHLQIERYLPSQLVQAGVDLLMLDNSEEFITIHIDQDSMIHADIELFSLALKNLIDNALKYSPNNYANISIEEHKITISNIGEALPYDIESYFTPFHDSKNSMGLGLYIVKSILDIHQMQLHYEYINGENHFVIVEDIQR